MEAVGWLVSLLPLGLLLLFLRLLLLLLLLKMMLLIRLLILLLLLILLIRLLSLLILYAAELLRAGEHAGRGLDGHQVLDLMGLDLPPRLLDLDGEL